MTSTGRVTEERTVHLPNDYISLILHAERAERLRDDAARARTSREAKRVGSPRWRRSLRRLRRNRRSLRTLPQPDETPAEPSLPRAA